MAALADKHGEIRSVHALSEHLRKHGVTIADNMLWKTLRDLEKREIIVSIRKPTFSVHLVMYWIAREKRLNWIREDLREELEQLDSGIELVPQEELPLLLKDDHVSSTNHEVKRFAIVGTLVYLFMALFVYTFVGTPPLYLILVGSWERSVDGMHMVYIPEGPFVRGSTLDEIDEALELCQEDVEGCQRFWADDEYPQHMVTLHGFWIDKTEVSFGQYELCVEQAVCAPSRFRNNDEHFALDKPVVGVSWYNAQSYCDWAGATLPTEAQWEKAARGESGQIFAWGNSFDPTKLNFCDASCDRDHAYSAYEDGFPYSAPIDAFPGDRSPYGVLNMSGNVSEWVYDNYNSGFYTQTIGAKNPLYISETENALGIQRGGSWSDARFNARVADRRPVRRGLESESGGFRCAIDGATFDIRRFFTFSSQ